MKQKASQQQEHVNSQAIEEAQLSSQIRGNQNGGPDQAWIDDAPIDGQQERQNKGFVTNTKSQPNRQVLQNNLPGQAQANKGQTLKFKNFVHQKTIPLNFQEDLKVGLGDGDKGLVNFDGSSNVQGEQWFLDNNYSVISRDQYHNNVIEKFDPDRIMFDQKYFSSPEQSELEYGLANAFSPQRKRQLSTNNDNSSQAQDYATRKLSNLRSQKRSILSMDNKFWIQNEVDGKYTERVNTDQDLIANPLLYQSQNSIGTKMEINTGKNDYQADQLPRLHFFTNNNQLENKNKILGQSILSQQELRQMLHYQQPNADLLSPPVQWKKKLRKNIQLTQNNDDQNDESDVEKKLDVNYEDVQKLDDKRFGLGVISKMRAQISQNQVKDDSFFMIVEKNSLEKIDSMTGRCVKFRQLVLRLITNTTHTASAIISSKAFDGVSLLVIVGNSISLALQDPTSTEGFYFQMVDYGFLAFYTVEMILKIIGLGFVFHKGSYLRDPWNMLDFTIVVSSYLPYIIQSSKVNLTSLRSFRVLRPLRTISGVPGLKVIVSSLLASLTLLKDTLVLLVFFFLIFGIAGLQVFSGVLKKTCVEIETGAMMPGGALMFCGGSYECPAGYFCGKANHNPQHNFLNYDNILYSLLACFVTVTLESWTYIMKYLQRSMSIFLFLFQVPLAFLGSFVLQNLTMAVVSAKYQEEFAKKKNAEMSKQQSKKKKMLLDFDNLDDDEKEKLKLAQEETRLQVLKKWKMILFIKQRMRTFVEDQRMRKLLEVKKLTQTGFDRLSMLESPSQVSKRKEIYDRETNYDPDASSRQYLTMHKLDSDLSSVKNNQNSLSDDKMRISKFSIKKNSKVNVNKNDVISEEDDEYRTEFSNIHGRSQNIQKSGLKGSSPASPFLDKQKIMFKNLTNDSDIKEHLRQDQQLKKMIILDSPDKILKMHGMAGLKYVDEQLNTTTQINANIVSEPFQINHDFFLNFINSELADIENQFSDVQLVQIAENLDIKEAELLPLIEDAESNQLSDNSIQSLDGHERLYISKHNVHQRRRRRNSGLPKAHQTNYTNIASTTKVNQQISDDTSTSGDVFKLSSNLVLNKNQEPGQQMPSLEAEILNSNEFQLASSISELALNKAQQKVQKNHSVKHVQGNKNMDELNNGNDQQKRSTTPFKKNDTKGVISNKWQNESTTLIIGNNNGTMINETLHTNKQLNRKGTDDKKLSSKVMPFGSGFYSSEKLIKLAGTNTIFRRDIIPVEQSILNSNFLVGKDIGVHKKIYLRKDKFDFTKPAEDIFEKREKQKAQIELEKTIKEQTDYLTNWKIKPYQRRTEFTTKPIQPDEEQLEYLTSLGLEAIDLAPMVQDKYNEPYLSNLYVTGTLSITLIYKKQSRIQHRTRKLQGNQLAIIEYYNQQASRSQSMNSSNISRKSSMKSSGSTSIGFTPVEIQKIMVMRSIKNQRISQTQAKIIQEASQAGISTHKQQTFKEKSVMNDPDNTLNATAQKKAKNLAKQAMKNHKFMQRLIISRVNKDAMKSGTFKVLIEKRKSRKNKSQIITDLDEHVTDDDDDDEKDEVDFQDTDDFKDDFVDRYFDNTLEIKKAKKQAVFKKRPVGLWSGQDVLEDFDPKIAQLSAQKLCDIRVWPLGYYGLFKCCQGYIRQFVRMAMFDNFLTLCVSINVIMLTLDKYPSDPSMTKVLGYFNTVFTYIFISELSLKVIGLGPVRYLKDRMNYLDGTVVLLSIVELLMDTKGQSGSLSAFKSIRIFRIFRILRIARLLRAMKSMTKILGVLLESMSSFIYLLMLLFLFLFIYTLLGMQIFGGLFNFTENDGDIPGEPRFNYNSFHQAFQAVFDILTIENWFGQLYDALRSGVNWFITILYMLSWIFLGNWMILNLFLAILLDGFSSDQIDEDPNETEQQKQEKAQKKLMEELDNKEGEELILYYQDVKSTNHQKKSGLNLKKKKKKKKNTIILDESFEFEKENLKKRISQMKNKHRDFEGVDCTYALYFLHKSNKIRRFLYKLQHHVIFEYVILVLIIASSGKLIMDTYIYSRPSTDMVVIISDKLDYAFTALFATESLIKSLALGFCLDNGSYLREFWNQLDCFIVGTSLLDVALYNQNTPALKVMKILRALRPLRFISHNRDMKTLVNTLAQSIGAILNVGVVCLIVWSMFAILGVNLFQGKLFYCNNAGESIYEYITAEECFKAGGQWVKYAGNFDNFVQAIITLFTVSTFENWPDVLHSLEDINDTALGPIRNNSPVNAYFLTAFILIGVFIFLNLFTGVLFMKFEQVQQEEKEETHLTDAQIKWIDIMKMIVNAKPDLETMYVPSQKWRKKVHRFVSGVPGQTNKFDMVIMAFIVLNMVLMTMDYETDSDLYQNILEKINYIFTAVFIFEATVKLISFGHNYFRSSWNIFDFFIVSTSILDIAVSNMGGTSVGFLKFAPQVIRVLRVLRVSRLFRLVNKYRGLSALIQTLQFSMPQLLNVFALVGLTYFIFAIVANFLFRDITSGLIIDEITNFSNFGYSYLTLVRMSTGEDWNYLMYDCQQGAANKCIPGVSCGTVAAIPFFIFFMLVQQNIILNLFVLVLCQQFDTYYLKSDNILARFKDDLERFKLTWTRLTTNQKCIKLKDTQMITFFSSMNAPLGFADKHPELNKKEKENYITAKVVKMEIDKDEYGFVYFNELLYKTMRRVYGQRRVKNSIIVQNELETMLKIEMIQNSYAKKSRIQEKQEIGSVNPFLLKMFMNISFKAWHKIYQDNLAIRNEDKYLSGQQDDVLSPKTELDKQESQENQQVNDEEYYYKTDQDVSYYSQDNFSESDYDDEYDNESGDDEYIDDQQIIDNGNGNNIIDKQIDENMILTERQKDKPELDSMIIPSKTQGRSRKHSDDEFRKIQQKLKSQQTKQGDNIEKAKKGKRRKTVIPGKLSNGLKDIVFQNNLKKQNSMKNDQREEDVNIPVLVNIAEQVYTPAKDSKMVHPYNEQIDESEEYTSNARLNEVEIIGQKAINTKRSQSDSLQDQSQEQIDENSQLVEGEHDDEVDIINNQ